MVLHVGKSLLVFEALYGAEAPLTLNQLLWVDYRRPGATVDECDRLEDNDENQSQDYVTVKPSKDTTNFHPTSVRIGKKTWCRQSKN